MRRTPPSYLRQIDPSREGDEVDTGWAIATRVPEKPGAVAYYLIEVCEDPIPEPIAA